MSTNKKVERISFTDLTDTLKAVSIANALVPSEESVYRSMCRRYSKTFHTPLHMVMDLEAQHVIMSVFEHQIDEMDLDEELESLMEMVHQIEDPEYDAKKEEELSEFAAMAEEEERERVRLGKKIGKDIPIVKPKDEVEDAPDVPKSASVNFGYLADSDNER